MQTLRAEHLKKSYGEKKLFEDLNFIINENDKIGLIGTNGSGKTTLLNVISGLDDLDSGTLVCSNKYKISYLMQHPKLDDEKTISEAIYDGNGEVFKTIREYEKILDEYSLNPSDEKLQKRFDYFEKQMTSQNAWAIESEVNTILTQLHIKDTKQKIKTLSGGQKKRVRMAQVLIQTPDLLILDEPTNHLDLDSIRWLEGYLASYKGSLLVVTHDRYFLDQITNKIYELSYGKLYVYNGNYQSFVAKKAQRIEKEVLFEHKQQQLYKKELAWIKTGAKARSTKQQARINRFNNLKDNLNKVQIDSQINIDIAQKRLGKKVFEIKN